MRVGRPRSVDEILDAEGEAVGGERHERRQGGDRACPAQTAPRAQTENQRTGDPDCAEFLDGAERDEEIIQRSEAVLRDPLGDRGVDRPRQAGFPSRDSARLVDSCRRSVPPFVETSR